MRIEGCAGKDIRLLNNIALMKFVASLCGASQPIFAVSQVHPSIPGVQDFEARLKRSPSRSY